MRMLFGAGILIVLFGQNPLAFSDDTKGPCEQIQRACGEAGFTRDLPAGKDLMLQCFRPLMKGQDVAGVKADPDLVKKCKEQQTRKPRIKKRRNRSFVR